jgi:hypothetical protein
VNRTPLRVELDVFSGRPNPAWQLDDDAAAHVRDAIASLDRAESDRPLPAPGLGYRGFRVTDQTESSFTVFDGVVRTSELSLADPDRRIERLLFANVPPEFADLAQSLAPEVGPADD